MKHNRILFKCLNEWVTSQGMYRNYMTKTFKGYYVPWDLNKGKSHIHFWLEESTEEKIPSFYLFIYNFNGIQTNIPKDYFGSWQADSKDHAGKSRKVLKKKEKCGRQTLPDLKVYYKVTIINCSLQIQKWKDEWSRRASLEVDHNI